MSHANHSSSPGYPAPEQPLSAAHTLPAGRRLPWAGVSMNPSSPVAIAARTSGLDGLPRYSTGTGHDQDRQHGHGEFRGHLAGDRWPHREPGDGEEHDRVHERSSHV